MMGNARLFCLIVACLAGSSALAGEVSITVHPDRVLNRIDEKVYGHFLEHIYHSVNGGVWGELVWDRSFEGGGAGVVVSMPPVRVGVPTPLTQLTRGMIIASPDVSVGVPSPKTPDGNLVGPVIARPPVTVEFQTP